MNSKRIFLLIPMSYKQRSLSEASNNCVNFSRLTLTRKKDDLIYEDTEKSTLNRNKCDFSWRLWAWWSPAPGNIALGDCCPPGKKTEPTVLQNIWIPLQGSQARSTPLKVALLYFESLHNESWMSFLCLKWARFCIFSPCDSIFSQFDLQANCWK